MSSSIQPRDVKSRAKSTYEATSDIWPEDDKWSSHTKEILDGVVGQLIPDGDSAILNAGCGGNDYGLGHKASICINLDISLRQCRDMRLPVIADIEAIPFSDNMFDAVLCVGAVINYCEPFTAIPELFRVTKPGGCVVLDFETTQSAELLLTGDWGKRVSVIERKYAERDDKTLLFSVDHIKRIVEQNGVVTEIKRYHTATAAWLRVARRSEIPAIVLSLDRFVSRIPILNALASNSIFFCQKT